MTIRYRKTCIPTSFATCSIGCRHDDTLPEKMAAIRNAGFDAIELAMPDILAYGKVLSGSEVDEKDFDALAGIAEKIRQLASELGLDILMLQPFSRFEGWKKGHFDKEREDAFNRARGWMKVMGAAGTSMLQVGSSDAGGISSSPDELAMDLAELADLCADRGFRVAYENWCWATRAPTWKTAWQIVEKADRPNLGLCLDTFQTAGGEFGDPAAPTGLVEGISESELETRWRHSLAELAATLPPEKIFLLQISDAYRMHPPLDGGPDRRSRWSHDYRPLPCKGGYLPVQDVLRAVLDTGFRGWLSVEVFDSRDDTGSDMEYATAAMESLKKLLSLSGS